MHEFIFAINQASGLDLIRYICPLYMLKRNAFDVRVDIIEDNLKIVKAELFCAVECFMSVNVILDVMRILMV